MSRSFLRLIEPLSEQLDIPEMMPPGEKVLICNEPLEINSILQLFLLWPEYSSAIVRMGDRCANVRVSHDESLSQLENLFLTVDLNIYQSLKNSASESLKIFFEIFGLTFQFEIFGIELAEEFSTDTPSVSISIPTSLERLGVRRSKRIQIKEPIPVSLVFGSEKIPGKLEEVSPRGFKLRVDETIKIPVCDRFKMISAEWEAEMRLGQYRPGVVVGLPIETPAKSFGAFFDIYVRFAYPMLRPRHSFPEDPIPGLAITTGQAKKFATKEQTDLWADQIKEAYEASRDAQYNFTADYVAVDVNGLPVGTSSLAKAFLSEDGKPMWAFHGVAVTQDPRLLMHTSAIYLWRSDFIICQSDAPRVVVWFDGKGRWLEKVYVKFQRLTSEVTKLWSVTLNRYVGVSVFESKHNQTAFDSYHTVGKFNRGMCSTSEMSLGFGVPYLNLSGGLDKVFYLKEHADPRWMQSKVSQIKPERFYCPVPHPNEAPTFDNYESHTVETVTRQVLTSSTALLHFHSSVEHSMAITRRKYAV